MGVAGGGVQNVYRKNTSTTRVSMVGNQGDINWGSIFDMVSDGFIKMTKEFIKQKALDKSFKEKTTLKGTLIMSFKLTVGRLPILDIDAVYHEGIIFIFPYCTKDKIITKYLFKVLPLLSKSRDNTHNY